MFPTFAAKQLRDSQLYFTCTLYVLTDIDHCSDHPCSGNGKCTDLVDGFRCSCSEGFTGDRCNTSNYQPYFLDFMDLFINLDQL